MEIRVTICQILKMAAAEQQKSDEIWEDNNNGKARRDELDEEQISNFIFSSVGSEIFRIARKLLTVFGGIGIQSMNI